MTHPNPSQPSNRQPLLLLALVSTAVLVVAVGLVLDRNHAPWAGSLPGCP